MKMYRKSAVTYIFYAAAILFTIYMLWQMKSAWTSIKEYYASMNMPVGKSDAAVYLLQTALQPLIYALVTFGIGFILNEVRKLNASYYKTKEELEKEKEAKKAAKEELKAAKIAVKEKLAEAKSESESASINSSIAEDEEKNSTDNSGDNEKLKEKKALDKAKDEDIKTNTTETKDKKGNKQKS